ncbi:MAG: bacillithiol biosynthesis deacetylase BshB1 [Acidobacteriota bacterium]|nr:bacillithiol biosynthesis deacetylase BshB1 [Acidobacteriota bacterium]
MLPGEVEVLLFGAHPDDVEWAVGGIAVRLRDENIPFAIVDMTKGEMGSRGTVEKRRIEARRAADYLNVSARENLELPDCGLEDSPQNRRLVASAIRRYQPKIVLAPLWEDRHPDHAAAGRIVQNSRLYCALKNSGDPNPPHKPGAFLFYPIHAFHQPTFVVDTSSVYARKLELIRIYESQFHETEGDFLFRLESRDRYFGSLAGVHHGEALVADQPIALSELRSLLSFLA